MTEVFVCFVFLCFLLALADVWGRGVGITSQEAAQRAIARCGSTVYIQLTINN